MVLLYILLLLLLVHGAYVVVGGSSLRLFSVEEVGVFESLFGGDSVSGVFLEHFGEEVFGVLGYELVLRSAKVNFTVFVLFKHFVELFSWEYSVSGQ